MNSSVLYLDCAAGISGDMLVGALLDLGADQDLLENALASLPLDGWRIEVSRRNRSAISCCDFNVILDEDNHDHDMEYLYGHLHGHSPENVYEAGHEHDHNSQEHHHEQEEGHGHHHHHHGRGLAEITAILSQSDLSEDALALALRIFTIIADAEGAVHGLPRDQVHFHEVGAVDSIIDVAAIAFCLDNLGIKEVIIPSLTDGTGTIRCQHGIIPVPVPAVTAIATGYHLPLRISNIPGELVTPTGAAAAAAVMTSEKLPARFRILRTGYGSGKRENTGCGFLRAMIILPEDPADQPDTSPALKEPGNPEDLTGDDVILKLETNIDDCTGEALGFVLEELMKAGARDVYYTPVYMKKDRPAVLLSVLCDPEKENAMEEIIFRNTTSIGIRFEPMHRKKLQRESRVLETPWGPASFKYCFFGEEMYCYPEHDSVAAFSLENDIGYKEVYNALKSFGMTHYSPKEEQ